MSILRDIRMIAALAMMAGAAIFTSCSGKEESPEGEVTISIVNTEVEDNSGSQFVTVTAAGAWTLTVEQTGTWATLSTTEGNGDGHAVLTWTANESVESRSCKIVVSSASGKYKANCTMVQAGCPNVSPEPTPDTITEDPVASWLELPSVKDGDGRYFITHDMTVGNYSGRNYSFYLDGTAKIAVWVAYPLNKGLIGTGSRTNAWGLDPKVPRSMQSVIYSGYRGGYERGHQIPSADRYSANTSTFYGTNMTPQAGELNEHAWASLEGMVRSWGNQFDTLYVVTGADINGSYEAAYDNDNKEITVPVGYFKALLGYKKSGTLGITGNTGGFTAIGFYFEHRYYDENAIMSQAMTIRELEKMTGFDFFVNLPDKITKEQAEKVETTYDSWWN